MYAYFVSFYFPEAEFERLRCTWSCCLDSQIVTSRIVTKITLKFLSLFSSNKNKNYFVVKIKRTIENKDMQVGQISRS